MPLRGGRGIAQDPPGSARLLVGVAEADLNRSREYLIALLRGLAAFGVDVQVALFTDGPAREALEEVADVMVVPPLPTRSAGGVAQALARRVGPVLAERVHDVRARAVHEWLDDPDGIHVHGPKATPVLAYARHAVPVTTYCHPWDFSIAGLSGNDRSRLLERTDRFLTADVSAEAPGPGVPTEATVVADLVAAGVDPDRVETAPAPLPFPDAPPTAAERAALRRRVGLDPTEVVVALPPVADWVDCPDLTLSTVWELERLAGDRTPTVLWHGMPETGDRRWPVDYDVERMGLRSLRLCGDVLTWAELVVAADVVVLPIRGVQPPIDVDVAVDRATPLLCWEGHDLADPVERWWDAVVPRGDVAAMAARLWSMLADDGALRRARRAGWAPRVAEIERVSPVEVPLP